MHKSWWDVRNLMILCHTEPCFCSWYRSVTWQAYFLMFWFHEIWLRKSSCKGPWLIDFSSESCFKEIKQFLTGIASFSKRCYNRVATRILIDNTKKPASFLCSPTVCVALILCFQSFCVYIFSLWQSIIFPAFLKWRWSYMRGGSTTFAGSMVVLQHYSLY